MNYNDQNSKEKSKSVWTEIIRLAIAVLSAIAATLGIQSCR